MPRTTKKQGSDTSDMTHLFCVIDRSGSMSGLEKATIDGYNEFVKGLRAQKNVKLTLVLFDHEYLVPVDDTAIADVKDLTREDYVPRGSTALIDAVCRTLNERKGVVGKKDKALVLVITDGWENASREYTSKDMTKLIHGLEKKGNWTFTYLGANQDAWAAAQSMGFQKGNVSGYSATAQGTAGAFTTMSANSAMFVSSGASNSKAFYADDKDKLEAK